MTVAREPAARAAIASRSSIGGSVGRAWSKLRQPRERSQPPARAPPRARRRGRGAVRPGLGRESRPRVPPAPLEPASLMPATTRALSAAVRIRPPRDRRRPGGRSRGVGGPSSGTPVSRSKSAPWHAHLTARPSIQPSLSGHSSCVHQLSTANQAPATRATATVTAPEVTETSVSSGRPAAVASTQVTRPRARSGCAGRETPTP